MFYNISLPSNHVELIGFDKEKSTFNKSTNSFEQLVFDLTGEPKSSWKEVFNSFASGSQSTSGQLPHFSFYNLQITSSNNLSVPLNDLQDYIVVLKHLFQSTNEYFAKLEKEEEINEENFNNVIDNLKF